MVGSYSVYLLIRHKTGNFRIAILALIHYNVLWGHFGAQSADCTDTTKASSMVPLFFLFFDKKKYYLAGAFSKPKWFSFPPKARNPSHISVMESQGLNIPNSMVTTCILLLNDL
jgi:hypothetical protein